MLGINIVSLSMPSQLSDYLQLNFGAECEPVREMSISTTSAEYTEWLKKKYSKKKNLLERGTQCTISYDVYESLLQHQRKLDDYQNEIVSSKLLFLLV